MLYLAAAFIIVAIILFIIAARQRRKIGIPSGRVIFTDTNKWGKVETPLYDPELRLTGKPDYLVRKGNLVIPIEVKSGQAHQQPAEWHIYQLAAYCLLVEYKYGIRPTHGMINYPNRTFAVDFTKDLEETTKDIIHTMQERTSQIQVDRSHQEQRRCHHCGYRSVCDQALRI